MTAAADRALARAVDLTDELRAHDRKRARLAARVHYWWLRANRAGVSYATLIEACRVANSSLAAGIASARGRHPEVGDVARGRPPGSRNGARSSRGGPE